MRRFATKIATMTMIFMTISIIIASLCYRFILSDIRCFVASCTLGSFVWTAFGLPIYIYKICNTGIIKTSLNPRLQENPEEAPRDVFIKTPDKTYRALIDGSADIVIFDVINFEEDD